MFSFSFLLAQQRPKVADAILYFENLNMTKLDDDTSVEVKYYAQNFFYYNELSGEEKNVKKLVDLLIEKEKLHQAYPEIFIEFFYKYHERFDESQIKKISLILDEIIKPEMVTRYCRVIGLYHLKKFVPNLRNSITKNALVEMKKSIKKIGRVKNAGEFNIINTLSNLDTAYQDSLLNLLRYSYDLAQQENNTRIKNTRKLRLYGVIIPQTLQYLTDYKEVISKTLYLLNENMVFPPHGNQPGVKCGYDYYYDLIFPHLFKNRKAITYWMEFHGDELRYFQDVFFEKNRTPELMRAALIEFGILEK